MRFCRLYSKIYGSGSNQRVKRQLCYESTPTCLTFLVCSQSSMLMIELTHYNFLRGVTDHQLFVLLIRRSQRTENSGGPFPSLTWIFPLKFRLLLQSLNFNGAMLLCNVWMPLNLVKVMLSSSESSVLEHIQTAYDVVKCLWLIFYEPIREFTLFHEHICLDRFRAATNLQLFIPVLVVVLHSLETSLFSYVCTVCLSLGLQWLLFSLTDFNFQKM